MAGPLVFRGQGTPGHDVTRRGLRIKDDDHLAREQLPVDGLLLLRERALRLAVVGPAAGDELLDELIEGRGAEPLDGDHQGLPVILVFLFTPIVLHRQPSVSPLDNCLMPAQQTTPNPRSFKHILSEFGSRGQNLSFFSSNSRVSAVLIRRNPSLGCSPSIRNNRRSGQVLLPRGQSSVDSASVGQ